MFIETEVSFRTRDDWTIRGILSLPELASGTTVAGVVLVSSPSHDRDVYGHNGYPSVRAAIEKQNIATLRIDIRGRGRSAEPSEYHELSPEQRTRVSFDVGSAIEFLCQQKQIDPSLIGVFAEGPSADAALAMAGEDLRVRALVLISGRIRPTTRDIIATRKDLAVLCVVSQEDKTSLSDMLDVYKLSTHPGSDIMILRDLGIGNPMFFMWAAKYPNERSLESRVANWLSGQLKTSTQAREVSFETEDGWTIFGTLRKNQLNSQPDSRGVVLVHSNLSDRHIFDELELALAGAGFAVLNIDFRGRGKSRGKGSYFDLSADEKDKGYLDIKAAMDFLDLQGGTDNLAIVATSVGVQYALRAASSDRRVKSFVVLGGLPSRSEVEKASFPFLFVSNQGVPQIAEAFEASFSAAKNPGSRLLKYEGGAVGYQLFEIDEKLQPKIVTWLKESV
jgi:pimeloyl-ACP methyl ester carboxylesterase